MEVSQEQQQIIQELEQQFSRLDSTVIYAISQDFDLEKDLTQIRELLEQLNDAAPEDENGQSHGLDIIPVETSISPSLSQNGSSTSTDPSNSLATESSNISDLSSLAIALSLNEGCAEIDLENRTLGDNLVRLIEMFPDMKAYDIEHALKKSNGSYLRAVDVLLNLNLLSSEPQDENTAPLRGSDALASEWQTTPGKKNRNRKNRHKLKTPTLIPHYAPVKLDDSTSMPSTSLLTTPGVPSAPSRPTHSFAEAASRDFDASRQYFRQSKSNPLFGAAASVYAERGRTSLAASKAAISAEADLRAARQSSALHVDLHGMNKEDGQRIASAYVTRWWEGLGESRIRVGGKGGVREGFQVIVGRGTHSAGGKSVMGPAVARTLLSAGWKARITDGVVLVEGRQR
jgi:hypothetical protein